MKRSYAGSWLTAGNSLPEFAFRTQVRSAKIKASAPGNKRAASGGACFRSCTATTTAAMIKTTKTKTGRVRLIRMECGQGCHHITDGEGGSGWVAGSGCAEFIACDNLTSCPGHLGRDQGYACACTVRVPEMLA